MGRPAHARYGGRPGSDARPSARRGPRTGRSVRSARGRHGSGSRPVVGEQRPHQPLVLRNGSRDQGRRQRYVQEEADALAAADRAQLGRQRDQVVVVDPDLVVGLQQRRQLAREQLVHAPVDVQVLAGVEVRRVQPVVEHRPQHAVAVAQVVAVMILPAQVHRGQRDIAGLLLVQFALAGRAALRGLHHLAAPAEPEPARHLQRLAQRDGQAAGRRVARIGDAVRYRHQSTHRLPCRRSLLSPSVPARGRHGSLARAQITESHGADRRTAPLIRPTIE